MNAASSSSALATTVRSQRGTRSLARLLNRCFALNIAGVVLLGLLSVAMSANQAELHAKHQQRYESYLLADELRQSSDDLTRMARTYVVTRDPRFERAYWDILAIRNGQKPRPQHYNRIYWDLVLGADRQPRPDGTAVALEELMRRAGFTPEEFAKLRAAETNSNELVQTETIAMNAVKGLYDDGTGKFVRRGAPDFALATRLMHDEQYHGNKARIMEPIDAFFALLDRRTQAEVESHLARARGLLLTIQALVVGMIGLSIATARLLPRSIFRRVGGEPFLVEQVVRRIAAGDLATPIADDGWARGGILGAMRETTGRLRDVLRNVQAAADLVADESQTMRVGSSRLAGTAAAQAAATTEAAAAMKQMAESMGKTALNAHRTQQLTRVAYEDARDTGQAVADAVLALRTVAQKLSAVAGITRRTHMISINAAIEAARAGAVGKEFAVVATEVRALAEHAQAITVEINHLIASSVAIAEKAGAMLAKLVPDIEQAAALVAEISTHTREQSRGADQVNVAIQQLVQGTQVCSSASTELSGLAERLAEESCRLRDAIAFFQLRDARVASAPPPTGPDVPTAAAAAARRRETAALEPM